MPSLCVMHLINTIFYWVMLHLANAFALILTRFSSFGRRMDSSSLYHDCLWSFSLHKIDTFATSHGHYSCEYIVYVFSVHSNFSSLSLRPPLALEIQKAMSNQRLSQSIWLEIHKQNTVKQVSLCHLIAWNSNENHFTDT